MSDAISAARQSMDAFLTKEASWLSEALHSAQTGMQHLETKADGAAQWLNDQVTQQLHSATSPAVAGGAFGNLSKPDAAGVLDQVTGNLVKPLETQTLGRAALLGGSAGLGLASLIGLSRMLRNSMSPSRTTYTLPPEIEIYEPARPEPRRRVRKVASGPLTALGLAGDPASELVAKDPWMMAKTVLMLTAGVPAGFWLGNQIHRTLGSVARQRELQSARADYEQALRESAALPAAGRGIKRASAPSDMERLADNCLEIAERAGELKLAGLSDYIPKSIQPMALATLAMLPLIGGYHGFKNRWAQRKQPALDYAERRANIDRELTSPTYPMASLVERDEPNDLDEAERIRRARESMDAMLADEDYGYIN